MGRLIACLLTCLLLFSACAPTPAIPPEPIAGVEGLAGDETNPASPVVEGLPDEVIRISFAAVGDNLVHPCIYIDARNRAVAGGRAYNFKPAFRDVAPIIAEADFAFINQETPMAGEFFGYSGYPRFNSPQDLGYDLVELGFDIIGLANNHMLDKGAAGYAGTAAFAKTLGATTIGAYESEEDYNNIRVIEKDGFKVALLAYTEHTNYLSLPAGSTLYVPYISDEEITRQVGEAKKIADAVIVSLHWGTENTYTPTAEQTRLAQLMADLGVTVILGHHSHTLQPIVELTGKEGNKTLCIYSLGNLISAMEYARNMLGGIFGFALVRTNGVVTYEAVSFIPTMYHFGPSYYNGYVYLLEDYTAELHSTHGTWHTYGKYSTLDDVWGILRQVIDNQYLPESIRK